MAKLYIEARPKGRPDGSHIDDYVVEDYADHILGTFKTQREAIDWAKKNGHSPFVTRVRHLNDKKKPDYWRAGTAPYQFTGTVVRFEADGFGIIEFDHPIGPSGNSLGLVTSSTTSHSQLTSLRPGDRVEGIAEADQENLASVKTFTLTQRST